ncbi:hypothetical protein CF394_07300 [Tetzosporium hominis]|uniref:Uncharacterized protein n=1 Tax=Tetzosporium hominis TaxID=2020506 RepID=A0A264W3M2_9BACL|nr:hypothetical protein CF394_07300 [Tetzosporium hominis]
MKHSLDLTAEELLAELTSAKRQQLDSSFIKLLRQQIYDRNKDILKARPVFSFRVKTGLFLFYRIFLSHFRVKRYTKN